MSDDSSMDEVGLVEEERKSFITNRDEGAKSICSPSISPSVQDLWYKTQMICKSVSWVIVLMATAFHCYRIGTYGKSGGETCSLMFDSGRWIGDKWQPNGCTMHTYTESEIRTCLQNTRVAFIGDSRIRALYYELAEAVSTKQLPTGKKHEDMFYKDKSNTSIEFYWITDPDPKPEKNMKAILKKLLDGSSTKQQLDNSPSDSIVVKKMSKQDMPRLIVFGVATHLIKTGPVTALVDYQENLRLLRPTIQDLAGNLSRLKYMDYDVVKTRFHKEPQLVWMMQDPVVEHKLREDRKKISNDRIQLANAMASNVMGDIAQMRIMNATTMMAAGKQDETEDGLHYSSIVLKPKVDALINSFCNDFIFPDDATCCKDIETITNLQYNAAAVFVTCSLLWIFMFISRRCSRWRNQGLPIMDDIDRADQEESASLLTWFYSDDMYAGMKAMAKLGVIMLFIFLADRSLIFMKAQKQYSHAALFIPIFAMFIGGIATWKPVTKPTVLCDEQLNEWKGWLITTTMLAKYTDAEKNLPIYVHVRLFMACFLFIVGFQHFRRFWYKGNYGLYKVCKVLARTNILCAVLCLVMGRPYAFYDLIPLASFWFIVVYIVMAFYPNVTDTMVTEQPKKYIIVLVKFAILFTTIFIVWGNESLCETVFSLPLIRELFMTANGGLRTWAVRSMLDRYTVFFGMSVCFIYAILKKRLIIEEGKAKEWLFSFKTSVAVLVVSSIAIIAYEIQAFTCRTEHSCNFTHSIASCVPILSFVLIRNTPGILRHHYSSFFAWVGEMSFELFLAQYHIWLVNDTNGILVLIPDHSTINAIVTTFVFIWITHEAKVVCRILADQLITKNVLVMLRRCVIFIIVLLIIWYHKSHEKKPALF